MKMITNIFLFILLVNLSTGFFAAAGVYDAYGVTYDTDLGTRADEVTTKVDKLTSEKPGEIGGTLVDLTTSGFGLLTAIGDVVLFGAGKMLKSFGAPGFVRLPITLAVTIVYGVNAVSFISGRDL